MFHMVSHLRKRTQRFPTRQHMKKAPACKCLGINLQLLKGNRLQISVPSTSAFFNSSCTSLRVSLSFIPLTTGSYNQGQGGESTIWIPVKSLKSPTVEVPPPRMKQQKNNFEDSVTEVLGCCSSTFEKIAQENEETQAQDDSKEAANWFAFKLRVFRPRKSAK
ncbi:uncharacterized protein [Dermacentor andersoni]|uniref:uncharacterized protein n=1 Tax=Dermacentor andersoni TaxID=34620 RepID=UPI003B3A64CA